MSEGYRRAGGRDLVASRRSSSESRNAIMVPMGLAEQIREARGEAGISQRELARRAGVPQSTIARIEAGALSPRVDTVTRVLAAMGRELAVRSIVSDHQRSLIRRMLELSPADRIRYAAAGGEAVRTLRSSLRKAEP